MMPSNRCSALALAALLLAASACDPVAAPNPPDAGQEPAATAAALPPGLSPSSIPAVPPTSKWALDPENSSVQFACKHVLSTVRGMFSQPSGTVALDETTPSNSRVDVTVAVSSITTGVEERDTHLKGPDFFDAAKYPAITFVSTGFTKASPTSYSVTGNLTMHGVTKPATFAVAAPPAFTHAGGIRRGIEATTTVNRKDFGLQWEFPGEGAGVVVGDNIQITINAELVLQP